MRTAVLRALSRPFSFLAMLGLVVVLAGADGCSSDPNVEGAKLYLNQKDYDQAIEALDKALAEDPNNVTALKLKGDALRMKAEGVRNSAERQPLVDEMVDVYQRAYAAAPDGEKDDIVLPMRVAWAQEMNYGAQAFKKAASDPAAYEDAVSAFRNANMIQPDSTAGYLNLGLAYLAKGDSDAAIEPLQAAIDRGGATADTYIYLGRLYLNDQRTQDALTTLEAGRDAFPDNDEIRVELLNAYVQGGQPDRAIEAYQAELEANPGNALYRYNYGSLLLQAERYDDAIAQLEQAVELMAADPETESVANAYYNLGAAYQNKALGFNTKAQELDDNDAPQAEIDAAIAQRDELLRSSLPALRSAREAFEAEGEDAADACRALFQVYAQLGQNDEARSAAECAGIDLD